MPHPQLNHRALSLLATAGLALATLPGCFSSPATTTASATPIAAIPKGKLRNTPTPTPNIPTADSGLEGLAAATQIPQGDDAAKPTYSELEAQLNNQARLAEEYKTQLDAEAQARAAGKPAPVAAAPLTPPPVAPVTPPPAANTGLDALTNKTTPSPALATNAATPQAAPSTPAVGATGEPVVLAPATAPVEQRFTMAADELARALRERAASSRTPAADYAALAWLDTIRPGVLGSLEAVPASRLLDPRQAKSINVTRDMLSRLVAEPALLGDHERLWRAISDAATPITQARDVRITTVELCTKVTGYGQYEPVTSRNLLAGVPHTLIVYAEVDSFTHRRTLESASNGGAGVGANDSERYTVDLGQAVEIWQDADRPTLQKRWGETQVKDISRRPRRDFYLTVMIDLPSNLSVGAYNLKLMVKDRQRNAQAERTIPFTIIADGALASSGN